MMLAFRNDLFFVDCNVYGINDLTQVPARCMKEDRVAEIDLTREEIQLISLSKSYKIITIQEIGSKVDNTIKTAIVIEELSNHAIRFLRADYRMKQDGSGRKLELFQLGSLASKSGLTESPLLKYRAASRRDEKT